MMLFKEAFNGILQWICQICAAHLTSTVLLVCLFHVVYWFVLLLLFSYCIVYCLFLLLYIVFVLTAQSSPHTNWVIEELKKQINIFYQFYVFHIAHVTRVGPSYSKERRMYTYYFFSSIPSLWHGGLMTLVRTPVLENCDWRRNGDSH